jgi:hypothetical protein
VIRHAAKAELGERRDASDIDEAQVRIRGRLEIDELDLIAGGKLTSQTLGISEIGEPDIDAETG